jgi:hypothetical protein
MASVRSKHAELFESEGRILRLEHDPAAPPEATAATLRIFAEVSSIALDAADVARVRRALRTSSPTKGRA